MKTKMYQERKANISAFRGCGFDCDYCAFQNTLRFQNCPDCKAYKPHAHLEALEKNPPKTKEGEFVTMALNGDIAFASPDELRQMVEYCNKWSDRTFVLQTKDPRIFFGIRNMITDNIIIGTTIETNINHNFSTAPSVFTRMQVMSMLECRKMITIEPIMKFDPTFIVDIANLKPEIAYVGYDSRKNKLPEPTLEETLLFISGLFSAGIDVREKLIRKAWNEV